MDSTHPQSIDSAGAPHRLTSIFVWAVAVLGSMCIGLSVYSLFGHPLVHQWLVLAAATVLSGTASLRIRPANVSISVSDVFVFASLVLFGPAAATITVALDALIISIRLAIAGSLPRPIFFFNVAAPALAMLIAGTLLFAVADPRAMSGDQVIPFLGALAVSSCLYFLLGTGLIATLMALQQRRSPIALWRGAMLSIWPTYAIGAYVAALLAVYGRHFDARILASLLPLPLILYFAFRASIGRVEDQVRHLAETNASYKRMIEAFAFAVDAKDQVTHGHIRRVQQACGEVARALGVTDADELRAIQAGALLHDLGKIAVPEHILNKPAKLTGAEFDQMKQHAVAGAHILSQVQFPYPLVPIVRHHHENWDGTGYPDGLRGESIPLGARILAVVDCYDALTSDRPYRSALTPEDALAIVRERRGTMYDPAVVDAFLRLQTESVSCDDGSVRSPSLPCLDAGKPGAIPSSRPDAALNRVCAKLIETLPAQLCLFFTYDSGDDVLVVTAGAGAVAGRHLGRRLKRGERVTGWVAAALQQALNVAAALDLHGTPDSTEFQSCFSVPVTTASGLIGVLTCYSTMPAPFDSEHVTRSRDAVLRAAASGERSLVDAR